MGKPICVDIAIRAPLDEVWRLTQVSDLHQCWDHREAVPPHVRPVREERRE